MNIVGALEPDGGNAAVVEQYCSGLPAELLREAFLSHDDAREAVNAATAKAGVKVYWEGRGKLTGNCSCRLRSYRNDVAKAGDRKSTNCQWQCTIGGNGRVQERGAHNHGASSPRRVIPEAVKQAVAAEIREGRAISLIAKAHNINAQDVRNIRQRIVLQVRTTDNKTKRYSYVV